MRLKNDIAGLWVILLVSTCVLSGVAPTAVWAQETNRVVIDRGTRLNLSILQTVSTKSSKEGDSFSALLDEPYMQDGQLLLPKGTRLLGTVSRVKRPGRFRGKAELFLCFDYVALPDGRQEPIMATITRLETPADGRLDGEGSVQAPTSAQKDVLLVLGGGAAGAGVGAAAGGKKGAAIGSAAGSLLGLVGVFWTRGQDIEIPVNTLMEVVVEKYVSLPAASAGAPEKPNKH